MKEYLNALNNVRIIGQLTEGRTKEKTYSTFGTKMAFSLAHGGINIMTTKKLYIRAIIHELLWMLSGDTNIKYLNDNKVTIWDEWANANGELGPIYGHQWRKFGQNDYQEGVDQIANVIKSLRTDPHGRRHIVSAWNPMDIPNMALPPCHAFFQFHVDNYKRLTCQIYQRSADMFLGVPFNIVFYSLLTHMVAHVLGYNPHKLIWIGGDTHIYENHLSQVKEQLTREPKTQPMLKFARQVTDIFDFKYEDFIIEGYDPHPAIKADVAV